MALIFLVAINVKAADDMDLSVHEQQSLVVEINKIESGSILSLTSSKGEVLFKDRFFKENNYSKVIDFKGLPDGKYFLTMDKEFIKSTRVITKKNNLVSIEHDSYSTAFKPCFKIKENMVSVYLANPAETYLIVEVFDSHGESVGLLKTKDLVLKKTFDFSRVVGGDYTFKIKTKTDEFVNTFTII